MSQARICFVVSSLHSGGAERVVSELANAWAMENHVSVSILTLMPASEDFYSVSSSIQRIVLGPVSSQGGIWRGLWNNLRYVRCLRKEFKQLNPTAVFSFGDRMNILTVLAAQGLGLKVVVSERTVPSQHNIGKFMNEMRKLTYARADSVVAQTEPVKKELAEYVSPDKIFIIPNPVSDLSDIRGGNRSGEIIGIGRFTEEKGFDQLLQAFALVTQELPHQKLALYGHGPLKESLQNQAESLGIQSLVEFRGVTKSPRNVLETATLFVLPSRYEGFPNIVLEAMAAGAATVAFDCPYGPGAIIRHGENGILVPPRDVKALAKAMTALLKDPVRVRELSEAGRKVQQEFGLPKILKQWQALAGLVLFSFAS